MKPALDKSELEAVYDRVSKRYDVQHGFFTVRSDQRGRELVVERAVWGGAKVLDAGAGTGSTGLLAAKKAGPSGRVVFFDMSEGMLAVAKARTAKADISGKVEFQTGDIAALPFDDESFDVALSTYSMCPLYDPVQGALELYRVVRMGGRVGIAHSTEPELPWMKWLADRLEDFVWRFPSITLGCRAVSVLPALKKVGAKVLLSKRIGVPLWPFLVFVVEKPEKTQRNHRP